MDDEAHSTDEPSTTRFEEEADDASTPEPRGGEPSAEGMPGPDPETAATMHAEPDAVPETEAPPESEAPLVPETPPALGAAIEEALTSGSEGRARPVPLELLFLRHADAGDPMTWPGDDADRPLSKKGRNQAKRLGRLLDHLNVRPDAVLASPRLRSLDTARLVAKRIGLKVHIDDRLGIDFNEAALGSLVAELDPNVERVMLVGHDPDFTHLVSWLVGASIAMRKGALARVDLADRTVTAGRGSLCWLLPPDAVGG